MKGFHKSRALMLAQSKLLGVDNSDRMKGTSTAFAFYHLYKAIMNPGKPERVVDHHGSKRADEMLLNMIADIARTLELEGFVFNRTKLTVTFILDHEKAKDYQVFIV